MSEAPSAVAEDDPTLRYEDGNAVADNQSEIDAFLEFVKAQHRKPATIQELRKWKLEQLNGKEVATDLPTPPRRQLNLVVSPTEGRDLAGARGQVPFSCDRHPGRARLTIYFGTIFTLSLP